MIYIIYISTFKGDKRNEPARVFTRYGQVNGGSLKNSQIKAKHSTWTKTLEYKHSNLEKYKTEHAGFTEGERENVVTRAEFGADELTDFSAGERGACQWCWVFAGMGSSLKRYFHAWDYDELNHWCLI